MSVMFTKFADKPRPILLDLRACTAAENFLGYGLHKILDEQSGPRAFLVILWAGLQRKDSELNLDETIKTRIGVAGGTASGKTTVSTKILEMKAIQMVVAQIQRMLSIG